MAGAIPMLRPLRESLAGDRVRRVLGIVNGTTNYILTRMTESGASFSDALEEAQALGYAEADPTADVEGFDAAAKAAILAALAFHTRVTASDVHREGITEVTSADVASARAMGCVVKLLAIAEVSADGSSVGVRAHPAMIPTDAPPRLGPGGVQRGLRRVRGGRRADVLRPRRGWRADGQRRAGRHRGRRPAQGLRRPRAGRVVVRRPAVAADGGDGDPLPRQPRRGRPVRRARPGGHRVRRAGRLDRDRAPGEARRRRRGARHRHPRRHRRRAVRDGRVAAAPRRRARGCSASCGWRAARCPRCGEE